MIRGRIMRGWGAPPSELVAAGGDVLRLYTTVFVIGAGLAGLGGAIVAPSQAISSSIDTDVLVLAFAISVIGGSGGILRPHVGGGVAGAGGLFSPAIPPPQPPCPPVSLITSHSS